MVLITKIDSIIQYKTIILRVGFSQKKSWVFKSSRKYYTKCISKKTNKLL